MLQEQDQRLESGHVSSSHPAVVLSLKGLHKQPPILCRMHLCKATPEQQTLHTHKHCLLPRTRVQYTQPRHCTPRGQHHHQTKPKASWHVPEASLDM